MTLRIPSTLVGGVRRIGTRNGLRLLGMYVVVGTIWQLTLYTAVAKAVLSSAAPIGSLGLPTVPLPLTVAAVGAILSLLVLQYVTVVAIRTLTAGHSRSIPRDFFTRRIGFVIVNSIAASLLFGVLVFVGSILFVIPGILAYLAFLFVLFYVAVEDEHVVAGFVDSWRLTRGHWIRLFVLTVVVFVGIGLVSGSLSAGVMLVSRAAARPSLGTLLSGIVTLPFSLLALAILADAFDRLRDRTDDSPEP
ncbi:MAG: hypothetical protein ABEJ60_03480 [Halodesulfurarchaeum sp.]